MALPPTPGTAAGGRDVERAFAPFGRDTRIGTVAPGLLVRMRILRPFLDDLGSLVPVAKPLARSARIDAVAGWGLKGAGHALAGARGLPYLALEDGFLRNLGLPRGRDRRLSLIADPIGIYYEARAPSLLEHLVAQAAAMSESDLAAARELMEILVEANLGKFNELAEGEPPSGMRAGVLVVDQIAEDLSIAGGLVEAATFAQMLEEACARFPKSEIRVRLHPRDGVKGRTGHLRALAEARGVAIDEGRTSFMARARAAREVYVASSAAGLEALIAGARVTCFGMPFYAGWGLTEDRLACPRRAARPSLAALVHAAYLAYPRYVSPLDGSRISGLDAARLLAAMRRRERELSGPVELLGVQRFKRRNVAPFFAPRARLRLGMEAGAARMRATARRARVVVWASRVSRESVAELRGAGLDVLFCEDGFLRSIGLGGELVPPASLVFDARGIYFDATGPSDFEALLQAGDFSPALLARAAMLRRRLVELGLSKYNVGARSPLQLPAEGRTRILVPGQVENDASIRLGAPEIATNLALLEAVRAARPDAFIAFKPHPDVEKLGRPGRVPEEAARRLADCVLEGVDPSTALEAVDEVHTLTSLMGFEALLRGLRVATYGVPFYAGWGLTEDRIATSRRTRRASLDELVAAALILYPRYADPRTGLACTVEDIVALMAAGRRHDPLVVRAAWRPLLRVGRKLRLVQPRIG